MFRLFRRKKKAFERDAAFYDDMYGSGGFLGQYRVHYTESRYYPVWRKGAEIITAMNNPAVLDIGCGPGQFARYLADSGITSYTGVDHSGVAIEMAREAVPEWAEHFTVTDIFEGGLPPVNFDIIVLFEVLEHLERDLDLLRLIPAETPVIFSVPSFWSKSHVRRFKDVHAVEKRYKPVIAIRELTAFENCPEPGKTIYLVTGSVSEHTS